MLDIAMVKMAWPMVAFPRGVDRRMYNIMIKIYLT